MSKSLDSNLNASPVVISPFHYPIHYSAKDSCRYREPKLEQECMQWYASQVDSKDLSDKYADLVRKYPATSRRSLVVTVDRKKLKYQPSSPSPPMMQFTEPSMLTPAQYDSQHIPLPCSVLRQGRPITSTAIFPARKAKNQPEPAPRIHQVQEVLLCITLRKRLKTKH
ncbi:hypothetical protein GGP41_000164 [Bipolaris sorokiniana]|uniref:Uncharacterized protein n=1 Tax=Cochliobolus sativus TaxID=45130 RepID=A0A8H6DT42_COCSA|nr:hypothetical protein GGP41_000164 [Bipolaris sorokiniana]